MSDLSLRPRSATELIDAAFRLYRQHFVEFVTVSAVVYLPTFVLGVIMGRLSPRLENLDPNATLAFMAILVVLACWYAIMEAALTIATSERYLGREIEPGRVLREALSRSGALIVVKLWMWFVLLIVTMFTFFLLLIPTIYFFTRYFALPATLLFERVGPRRAIARSRELAKGERWKILKSLGLVWLLFFAISLGIGLVFAPERGTSPSVWVQLISSLVSIVAFPLVPITATLLYYDTRIRQEGFDIELMSANLESAAGTATSR